jgi:hypothetical protein
MAATAPAVPAALTDLDKLDGDLRAAYGHRAAHAGRLDQIESIITNLRSLVAQLPDEEAREAEFEGRLLAKHDAGEFDFRTEPSDHVQRLREGIGRRKAAGK